MGALGIVQDVRSLQTSVGTKANQSDLVITNTNVTSNSTNVGALTSLTTTAKTSIVNSINEIDANRYKKSDWTSGINWDRLPSGLIIQRGYSNVTTSLAVTFPIAFTSVNNCVVCTIRYSNTLLTNPTECHHNTTTASAFQIYTNASVAYIVDWIAIGY